MTPLLIRLLGFAVVFTLFCGCALTRDRFRPMPTQGQTREQGLKDQEECNDVALANKGSAAQASAMGSPVGVAAGFLVAAIAEVERRGTAIYVMCMEARRYAVGE